MKKISALFFFSIIMVLSLRADVLFQDSSNYPYADGLIEGQGQWYCYYPTAPYQDALVTNNILLLNTTNHDEIATPMSGWNNPTEFNYASFTINVSQLPASTDGSYFCQFQDKNGTNHCCHVFIDTRDTVVPGTYRLGIANFSTSFSNFQPPNNYPMDLATGITYTVVILYDTNQDNYTFVGSTLWVNPSEQDYQNVVNAAGEGSNPGDGFVYGSDTTTSPQLLDIDISQIGFSPYANAGISNVIAGTTFDDVNTTNLPVFGIQPQPGTNYSGNSATFYAVASGVDVAYQWYSTSFGMLSDGPDFTGSTSNILVVNNLSASDTYYCEVTDFYGNSANSSNAEETVITTLTAPFFTQSPINLTNNLFTSAKFTDVASGTGPLYYQWYFAPTNTPDTYAPLAGQTSPSLVLTLADYSYQGNYYVMASNSIGGGSIAFGPTNTLTELAPLAATMLDLHNLQISYAAQIAANPTGTITINSDNVIVSGYVSQFSGYGTSYTEYFIQDSSGLGVEVYLYGYSNTNTPPIGTYVTISGPLVIYRGTLEIEPNSPAAIVTTNFAPTIALAPRLDNDIFTDLAINGAGTNALLYNSSLITFSNVYIYGSLSGGAIGSGGTHSGVGGIFYSNSYTTLYFTVGGPYSVATGNTNMMEIYQPSYNYGPAASPVKYNPFSNVTIPTNCYQLTGVYEVYEGYGELLPSRLADYVTNAPPAFTTTLALTNGASLISWPVQTGSTYRVYDTTNLTSLWIQAAYGLAYYPTNGAFTDTNKASAKFYRVSSP